MVHRFGPIFIVVIASLMLVLIRVVPPLWGAAIVALQCAAASLAFGWMISRSRPSRLPGPALFAAGVFGCLLWLAVAAHTAEALFRPKPAPPERVIARKVGAVSVFVLVTTIEFMILRGEFRGYRARRQTGR